MVQRKNNREDGGEKERGREKIEGEKEGVGWMGIQEKVEIMIEIRKVVKSSCQLVFEIQMYCLFFFSYVLQGVNVFF